MATDERTVTQGTEARLLVAAMVLINLSAALVLGMITTVSDLGLYRALAILTILALLIAVVCSEVAASKIVRRIGLDKAGFLPFQFLRPVYLREAIGVVAPGRESRRALATAMFVFPTAVLATLMFLALIS
jgi:hypothetical protein